MYIVHIILLYYGFVKLLYVYINVFIKTFKTVVSLILILLKFKVLSIGKNGFRQVK